MSDQKVKDLFVAFFLQYINVNDNIKESTVGGSGVTSTQGTLYGGVVMGVLLSFDEAAIL
jgi:hypothetical protein